MKKDDNRRDFLKKVWAVPAVIVMGTLTNPVSAEAGKPDKPGKPDSHPGQGKPSHSKVPNKW